MSADQLAPASTDELVSQLNRVQRWITWWGVLTVACVVLSFVSLFFLIPAAVVLVGGFIGYEGRRVVLHYEADSDLTKWFNELVAGWPALAQTKGKWRHQESTHLHHTRDRKVNAGARDLVSRKKVSCPKNLPLGLSTNVEVPIVSAAGHSLLFLPDRLLVQSAARWSDVDYRELDVSVRNHRFVETGTVPRDGVKVSETWQYANVKGGPDRRFKNNRRLPVMQYSEVVLSSPQGLSWSLSLSRNEVATWWQQTLRARPKTPLLSSSGLGTEFSADQGSVESNPRVPAAPVSDSTFTTQRGAKRNHEHVPPSPVGTAREPWGLPWSTIEVAGESYHEDAIAALFAGVVGVEGLAGAELQEAAVMVPDPGNPHGEGHALAVFVRGHHVGYVPHVESAWYFPQVAGMTARGVAVTVRARVWASANASRDGFRSRVTLSVPEPEDFDYPRSMPSDKNVVVLPPGNALQVTGEEKHVDFLRPYLDENVAVTLHKVTTWKAGKSRDQVEVRLDGQQVGHFTPATSAKVGPLVEHVERAGGLPVARAGVAGNELRADVTVYVARAGNVPQDWFDGLGTVL